MKEWDMKAKLKTKAQLLKEGWSYGTTEVYAGDLMKDGEPDAIVEPMVALLGTEIEIEEADSLCLRDATEDAWNWPRSVFESIPSDLPKAGIADSDASQDVDRAS